jgi:hypothetical protein
LGAAVWIGVVHEKLFFGQNWDCLGGRMNVLQVKLFLYQTNWHSQTHGSSSAVDVGWVITLIKFQKCIEKNDFAKRSKIFWENP